MCSAQELISSFEEEQRSSVFSSLSAYLHQSLFADIQLVCGLSGGGQQGSIRAHKVVLAASSKFFSDLFSREAGISVVDLDRELAPNDLQLDFQDLRLIVGILYCVGTVEISPPKIRSLLVVSQVLGIPTLTRFLRKIRQSIEGQNEQINADAPSSTHHSLPGPSTAFSTLSATTSSFQAPRDRVLADGGASATAARAEVGGYVCHTAALQIAAATASVTGAFINGNGGGGGGAAFSASSSSFYRSQRLPDQAGLSPSSSCGMYATSGGLSFSQQLPSPMMPARGSSADVTDRSKAVSSVLDSLDPSFLNNFPATQIDDLESALLPHLTPEEQQAEHLMHHPLPPPSEPRIMEITNEEDGSQWRPEEDEEGNLSLIGQGEPTTSQSNAEPSSHRTPVLLKEVPQPLQPAEQSVSASECQTTGPEESVATRDEENGDQEENQAQSESAPSSRTKDVDATTESPEKVADCPDDEDVVSDASSYSLELASSDDDEEEEVEVSMESPEMSKGEKEKKKRGEKNGGGESHEVSVCLDMIDEAKSIKFAIPGSSKSVTLNFSADALKEMRNSFRHPSEERRDTAERTTTSTLTIGQVKSPTKMARADPSSKRRHAGRKARRKVTERPKKEQCPQCSRSFASAALLEKHLAFHGSNDVMCGVCGRVFLRKWELERHAAVEHAAPDQQGVKCDECGKVFRWKRSLLGHLILCHQKERRYRCKFCPLTFLKKKFYIAHQTSKHPRMQATWCKVGAYYTHFVSSRCFSFNSCAWRSSTTANSAMTTSA